MNKFKSKFKNKGGIFSWNRYKLISSIELKSSISQYFLKPWTVGFYLFKTMQLITMYPENFRIQNK